MSNFNFAKTGTSALTALLICTTAAISSLPTVPAAAQQSPSNNNSRQFLIPTGTRILVSYDEAKKIIVNKGEFLPLTLKVASNLTDRNGAILIPAGSEIVGQLEPTAQGVQFVAQELIINEGQSFPLDATSRVISKTEIVREGASAGDVVAGTLAGAGTATLLAGTTGDHRIDLLEVLGGAAVGALAGWGLPAAGVFGGGSREVISINPNQDLTLTLQSSLALSRINPYRSGNLWSNSPRAVVGSRSWR